MKKTKDSTRGRNPLLALFFRLLIITVSGYLLLTYVLGIYPVHGNRMFPMLRDGDLVITQKLGNYAAGQIVTYRKGNVRYFARIAAVAGDRVEISPEGLLINGMVPAEEVFYETVSSRGDRLLHLEEGMFYVLNDYRTDEKDSRTFGPVAGEELDGKVIFLFRHRNF